MDTGALGEHYIIRDAIWLPVAPKVGMLCVGCFEARLGRKLAPPDFLQCYPNNARFATRSARLVNRMQNSAT